MGARRPESSTGELNPAVFLRKEPPKIFLEVVKGACPRTGQTLKKGFPMDKEA